MPRIYRTGSERGRRPDEDAFRAVGPDGLTVAASDRVSGAEFRVNGPAEVERLLEEVREVE